MREWRNPRPHPPPGRALRLFTALEGGVELGTGPLIRGEVGARFGDWSAYVWGRGDNRFGFSAGAGVRRTF